MDSALKKTSSRINVFLRTQDRVTSMVIDRAAIILRAKKPAVDWINQTAPIPDIDPLSLPEVNSDSQLYLVPDDVDTEELATIWAYTNADVLLQDFLSGWHQDESLWPKTLDTDLFKQWFAVEYHSLIIDTVDAPINKADF
ncbi:hypothetical protein [Kistimonas asteriae]|uniref:hypothetical protein n=1 Tax=Kistimonas asteriae TaxID=517724 RepID=UPI001BA54F68|nr:hypothetical protein [Kistimonas asteriae]